MFANRETGMSAAIRMGENCWNSLKAHVPVKELMAMGHTGGVAAAAHAAAQAGATVVPW